MFENKFRNFDSFNLTNDVFLKENGIFSFLSYHIFIDIVMVHHMESQGVATVRGLSMRLRNRVSYPKPFGLNSVHFYSAHHIMIQILELRVM